MSVDERIGVLKIQNLCNNCLKPHSARCKSTFNCRTCSRFYNTLIHFNVSENQIETSDFKIVLMSEEHSASASITQSGQGQTGVSGTALVINIKDKQSTGLLCTVNLFIENAFRTQVR